MRSLRPSITTTHPRDALHSEQERAMNRDRIEGNWKQLKGKIKQQWGRLTDDDLDVIDGKRDELAGRVQKAYGVTREEAEKQVTEWMRKH
jgi:uncharacterized protein YjbJ (UPF0337 family)